MEYRPLTRPDVPPKGRAGQTSNAHSPVQSSSEGGSGPDESHPCRLSLRIMTVMIMMRWGVIAMFLKLQMERWLKHQVTEVPN